MTWPKRKENLPVGKGQKGFIYVIVPKEHVFHVKYSDRCIEDRYFKEKNLQSIGAVPRYKGRTLEQELHAMEKLIDQDLAACRGVLLEDGMLMHPRHLYLRIEKNKYCALG